MNCDAPMRFLGTIFGFPFYWARRGRFINPGLYVWTGKKNLRVFPFSVWRKDIP